MRIFNYIRLFYWLFFAKKIPDIKYIERMGLLAVKVGQMYALRSDFLGTEKCQHLSVLYESASQSIDCSFKDLLKKNGSSLLQESLVHVDEKPLAVASIGQVHRGVLKDGTVVAIKIIKDDFKRCFLKDIYAMQRFLKFCLFFSPQLKRVADPIGTLNTIKHLTLTELDLKNEIKGIDALILLRNNNKSRHSFLNSLSFPRYYESLSNSRIFVSQFIKGQSFSSLLDRQALSYKQLLNLFRVHGFYVFVLGEFHGDLHPGNIFLCRDEIIFLDNSNIERVPLYFGKGIVSLLFYLAEAQYKKSADALHNISRVKISDKRYLKFETDFIDLYKNFNGKTVSEISLTSQMMKTVKLAVHAGMEFEDGMFSVIKTLMYLDGMVLKCNPDAILLKDLVQFKSDLMVIK